METNQIVTMETIARICKICDMYLQKEYNTTVVDILNTKLYKKPEILMMLLLTNPEIKELFDKYNIYEIMYQFFAEFGEKKIFYLSDDALIASRKKAIDLTDEEYIISKERLDNIFKALENNLVLYENLYKDKVWVINSSIGKSDRIEISPERFFHLMGFDEKDFSKKRNPDALDKFVSIFSDPLRVKSLLTDRKDLYGLLYYILDQEQEHLKMAIADKTLKGIVNPQKLEIKSFGFERIGMLQHPSGMIFFDKNLADELSEKDENGKPKFHTHIKGDLILLSNFIRKYNLDFIFEFFKLYNPSKQVDLFPIKNAESLVIPKDGYEKSNYYVGQQASISESAVMYPKKDFEFDVKLENENDGKDDGDTGLNGSPEKVIIYDDVEKAKMAKAIIDGLPQLDNEHLKEVHDGIMNKISLQNGQINSKKK